MSSTFTPQDAYQTIEQYQALGSPTSRTELIVGKITTRTSIIFMSVGILLILLSSIALGSQNAVGNTADNTRNAMIAQIIIGVLVFGFGLITWLSARAKRKQALSETIEI